AGVSDTVTEASHRRLRERVEIERRLLVRVRGPKRRDDLRLTLGRVNRLETQLRDALFSTRLPNARRGRLAREEGARSLRVPGATLVVADPSGPGLEQCLPDRVEGLARHEHDELAVHVCAP